MTKAKQVNTKLKKEGDFVPPDGGWGWMIVVAAGFSNVSRFYSGLPCLLSISVVINEH